MEHDIHPGDIRDKMLALIETCIRKHLAEAEEADNKGKVYKATGDHWARGGNEFEASTWHAMAMNQFGIRDCHTSHAVELAGTWDIELDEVTEDEHRWTEKRHRGVGEGDEGLPEGETPPCGDCREPDCKVSLDGTCARTRREAENPRPTGGTGAGLSKLETTDLNPQ